MAIRTSILDNLFQKSISIQKCANARITAAVVLKNTIIAEGNNSLKTHPFQKKYGKNCDSIHLHAEVDAVIKALKVISVDDIAKCDLYIARSKQSKKRGNFHWGLAKPCDGCKRMIAAMNIKSVYYTTNEDGVIDYL